MLNTVNVDINLFETLHHFVISHPYQTPMILDGFFKKVNTIFKSFCITSCSYYCDCSI
ncbi:unknown [Salmonella phage FelixO1]|uniref:Uncharacterized protein n=1 Tax=Salmonella phage Felix O1 (isolate Felix O1-VT1) TaxID=1283336 RepID=Q6KGT3_BPFO1|nr:unknown [Salmonella phage FelixO1]